MLPLVITEDQVKAINIGVYLDGTKYQAVMHQDRLYRLVKQFAVADRLQAHVLGCDIAEQEIHTLVTASDRGYSVWVDAKQPHPLPQETQKATGPRLATAPHAGPPRHATRAIGSSSAVSAS